jgi:hypothetical protein
MKAGFMARHAPVAVLIFMAAWHAGIASADELPAPTTSRQVAASLLSGMADYLAGLAAFRVRLIASYDAPQSSGEKIEFNEVRQVTLSRPNLLRVEQRTSDGTSDLLLFDGREIVIFDSGQGVYAKAPQPGSIDEAVVYFVRDLGMRLPLAAMLSTRLPEELSQRVKSMEYVEYTEIFGAPAHHIAARGNTVDMQVWIADGERPLPLRIVLTYKTEPGLPQFRAQFVDWDWKPATDPRSFRFVPPPGARQVVFAVQGPPVVTDPGVGAMEAAGGSP